MAVVQESVQSVTQYLEKSLNTKTIIGEAYKINDRVTLIPVIDVIFGYGAGSGEGKAAEQNMGVGGGGGAGARLSAKAIIAVVDNQVQVLPLVKETPVEKLIETVPGLFDKIPQIVEKFNLNKEVVKP